MKYLFKNFNHGTTQVEIRNENDFKEILKIFKFLNIRTSDRRSDFKPYSSFNRRYRPNMKIFRIFSYPHRNAEVYCIYDIGTTYSGISLEEFKEKLNINFLWWK